MPLLKTGFRMVMFSVILMVVVLFFRTGIMGDKEFRWDRIAARCRKLFGGKRRPYPEVKTMSESMLRMENVTMQFGGVVAVNNLSLNVDKGEIVALIGPNGAGKTTAFNCITGVYQPTNGKVFLRITSWSPAHPTGKMQKKLSGHERRDVSQG